MDYYEYSSASYAFVFSENTPCVEHILQSPITAALQFDTMHWRTSHEQTTPCRRQHSHALVRSIPPQPPPCIPRAPTQPLSTPRPPTHRTATTGLNSTARPRWWEAQRELWLEAHTEAQFWQHIDTGTDLIFVGMTGFMRVGRLCPTSKGPHTTTPSLYRFLCHLVQGLPDHLSRTLPPGCRPQIHWQPALCQGLCGGAQSPLQGAGRPGAAVCANVPTWAAHAAGGLSSGALAVW